MERNRSVSGNVVEVTETTTPRRRTSGGPVLQDDVTAAIEQAFFEELSAAGYGRLSIDAVAKRAGVGKAAIYRRWKSKSDLTVDLVSKVAVAAIDIPDTGTLRGDLRQYLVAEATRNGELATMLGETVREPRRIKAIQLLERARDRGEIPKNADVEVVLDMIAGPLYWRQSVMQLPAGDDYLDRLADSIVAVPRAG